MRRPLLVLLAVLSPTAASAGLCVPDSLAGYILLGGTGCTIGNALFSQFATFAPPGFATEIDADNIAVTPLDLASGPGLQFAVNATAGPGEVLQALFGYQASGMTFVGNRLSIAGTQVTPDGVVTVVENKCLGGVFDPDPTTCTETPDALIVFDLGVDAELEALVAFGGVALIGVVNDVVIDGGLGGSAELASATNQFSAVPEPATGLLLAAGAALGALRLRRPAWRGGRR
jgi:hypothetical protein